MQNLVAFAAGGSATLIGREELSEREETARMLLTTSYSNKMSLDMRLVDPYDYGDHPRNKASKVSEMIKGLYEKYDAHRGTQFVFSDLGTYKKDEWNVYSEIKRKLHEDHDIPKNEIAFIQEAASDAKRKEILDKMNSGDIRVLFGSTQKLGTGVNAQQRVVAMHHLDIPWKPSELKQRNGRGQRTGNEVAKRYADNTVMAYVYATDRSLDSYKFNILKNKQVFIHQLKSGQAGTRTIDEGAMSEDGGINFATYAAITSGNTDLLEEAKLKKRIAVLESERAAFNRSRADMRYRLESAENGLEKQKEMIETMENDLAAFRGMKLFNESGEIQKNPLVLDGKELSGYEAIAAELHRIEKTENTAGHYRKVGSLGEFKIIVKTEKNIEFGKEPAYDNKFFVQGAGNVKYTHNHGAIAKDPTRACEGFINALTRIPSLIETHKAEIESYEKDIPAMRKLVGEKFSKDEELAGLRAEWEALDRKIQLSLKPIEEQAKKMAESSDADHGTQDDDKKNVVYGKYGQDEKTKAHLDSQIVIARPGLSEEKKGPRH